MKRIIVEAFLATALLSIGCKSSGHDAPGDMAMRAVDGTDMLQNGGGGGSGGGDLASPSGTGDMAVAAKTVSFAAPQAVTTSAAHAVSIGVGDFNHDGNADLLVLSWSGIVTDYGGTLDPQLSKGDGTFTYDMTHSLLASATSPFAIGDVNADNKDDISYFYSTCVTDPRTHTTTCTPHLVVATSNGDGTFAAGGPPAPTAMSSIGAKDLNGDGAVDFVATASGASSSFSVYLNNGANPMTKTDYSSPGYPAPTTQIIVADLNGDTYPDVFYAASGSLVVGSDSATGALAPTPSTIMTAMGVNAKAVAVADLNGDTKPDLIVANDNVTFSVYAAKATGGYASPNDYPAVASPTAIATGDFDGDGLLDVVTCDGNNLRVFVNQGNGFKTPVAIAQVCNRLAVADFNHDGQADIAVVDGNQTAQALLNTSH